MKSFSITTLTVVLLCLGANGQTKVEIRAELDAVGSRISNLRREAMEAPVVQELREEMHAAEETYREAVAGLPGMSDIDQELKQLRARLSRLNRDRMMLLERHEAELRSEQVTRQAAHEAYRTAAEGGAEGKALRLRQRELIMELSGAQQRTPQSE